eukprot:COSAG05_NODE_628_length_8241_cov_5.614468_5_plen_45_part_00
MCVPLSLQVIDEDGVKDEVVKHEESESSEEEGLEEEASGGQDST